MTSVLIVEDDKVQRAILTQMVAGAGFSVLAAAGGAEALTIMNGPEGNEVDLVLLDLMMPVVGGMEVLTSLRETRPGLPIIVLTAHGGIDRVVEVMRAGADDFIPKPPVLEKLIPAMEKALERRRKADGDPHFRNTPRPKIRFEDLIGESGAMKKAIETARKGALSNVPILIEGESGVGKEMFARAIQAASDRADKPFIAVNCGAIPPNLVESILFGHEKGAFTGATRRHDGKFQEADGGTLFLDEVGELPLEMQVKLLRAIQEGEVDPVGSSVPVKVDIRLISATNKRLIERVGQGKFREDLMYRLNVFPVHVPPLRARRDDIPLLVEHFAEVISAAENRQRRAVSTEAMELLTAYDWPGNVRQLENAMFRAVILADGECLTGEDFPQILNTVRGVAAPGEPAKAIEGLRPVLAVANPPKSSMPSLPAPADIVRLFDADGELRPLSQMEAEVIEKALTHYNGHMSEIARRLGIGRSTLYRKITDLGLDAKLPAPQRGGA